MLVRKNIIYVDIVACACEYKRRQIRQCGYAALSAARYARGRRDKHTPQKTKEQTRKSKPPVNWWFTQTLKGFNAGTPVNGYRNLATHHYSLATAMSRLSFLPYLFLIPVNGSMYSLMLIWSCIRSSSNCFLIYSWITRSFRPTVST